MSNYFLKSSRLGFRCWTLDDLPLALDLWGDPAVSVWSGGPFTPDQIRARIEDEIRRLDELGFQFWPVFLLATDEFVGCAGLRPQKENVLEMGYHLRARFWGQGLATEAASAVIEYAFDRLPIEALFAGHHPSNTASRRVLEKLGFAFAGEEHYPPTGAIEPTYLLPRSSWRPQRHNHQSSHSNAG
jgi:ribosomal-protein-alanine N-acetyltransferase